MTKAINERSDFNEQNKQRLEKHCQVRYYLYSLLCCYLLTLPLILYPPTLPTGGAFSFRAIIYTISHVQLYST